ncbi:MAG: RNA 2'-phosphotransferase [Cyanobacteria bacterium P01_C01_bin.72]
MSELKTVVEQNDKQRFSCDLTGKLIRANQGHSVEVDLQLQPFAPPLTLYHGTHLDALESILQNSLRKMNRHHVHLSTERSTAQKVSSRREQAIILEVNTGEMAKVGFQFYCSDNGVWLVDHEPPKYIQPIASSLNT